jgi:hypothetical protein
MQSTSTPIVYPCKTDIVVAVDVTLAMNGYQRDEIDYVFNSLADTWIFSNDSVTATVFGYGIGFLSITPTWDYKNNKTEFDAIHALLNGFSTFTNTSLNEYAA